MSYSEKKLMKAMALFIAIASLLMAFATAVLAVTLLQEKSFEALFAGAFLLGATFIFASLFFAWIAHFKEVDEWW